MKKYIALFEQVPGKESYSVTFPDFSGCISTGDSFDDAWRMAHDALAFHVSGMLADGEQIPNPRSLEEIKATWEEWKEWAKDNNFLATKITLLPCKNKAVRFSITMDKELLAEIDSIAKNRSTFLATAAKKVLKVRGKKRALVK